MKKTVKKAALAVVGILAAGALLAGCSSGTANSSASSGKKVTLTFQSLAYQDTTVAAVKGIVASWNKANPKIQVDLRQGSWDNVHDQLVTQFAGGTAPDIIHDESADIAGFASQGYLADLSKSLDTTGISKSVLKSVTSGGKLVAAPTLLQSYVVFANTDAFAKAGVPIPNGASLSWKQFATLSKKLTAGGNFGLGWGLAQPTSTIMNLSLGFGGNYFSGSGATAKISVGANELAVPEAIHDMAYKDASLDPVSLTQSGSDVLPGFLGGKYAMYVGGNYVAQQLTETAPAGFHWAVLPPLTGSKSSAQAANPQTISVSAQSKHIPQATKFVNYFTNTANLSKLARGDWLIPASAGASAKVESDTKGADGWKQALASGKSMTAAPFQSATNFPQWKDQIATPAFQQYFGNKITADDLKKKLTDGWASVSG
jgi:multiple sugar transport system substrate-binding protein